MTMTATASAPGHHFSKTSVALSMSLADPDRSRIAPMKMNMGIDASTGALATPPHMRSTMSDRPINLKNPNHAPKSAKMSDNPPMMKATREPKKTPKNIEQKRTEAQ